MQHQRQGGVRDAGPHPERGETFGISFNLLDDEKPVEVTVEVAWRNTERDRKMLRLPLGCGLHFIDLSAVDLTSRPSSTPIGSTDAGAAVPKLVTPRLALIAAAVCRAAAADRAELARLLSARVPASWPPELMADHLDGFARRIEADAAPEGWLPWYWVTRDDATLVGNGGFGARPAEDGSGKFGYALVPEHQGRGYATEAVAALLEWAFSHPGLARVVADT